MRSSDGKSYHQKLKYFRGFLLLILVRFLEHYHIKKEVENAKKGKTNLISGNLEEKELQYCFCYLFSRDLISFDEFIQVLSINKIIRDKLKNQNKINNNKNNDINNNNNNNNNNINDNIFLKNFLTRIYDQMENFFAFILFLKKFQLENYLQYEKYFPFFENRLILSPSLANIGLFIYYFLFSFYFFLFFILI